jgi:hypothetical protein
MHKENFSFKSISYNKQRGIALLILLLVLGSGALYGLLRTLNQNSIQMERDKKTTEALALAKEALIGYAVSRPLISDSTIRPGELPCPDMINDGRTTNSRSGNSCSLIIDRLGRLPWKELGLPDLRDGYGERLWYAVSNNYKNRPQILPLNSNTNGTISIKNSLDQITYGNTLRNGVIAVIIAPGAPITRKGAASAQYRGCGTDTKCLTEKICTASAATPSSNTPLCSPANYLDSALGNDNALLSEATSSSSSLTGFIQGNIVDSTTGNTIVNDRFVVITYEDLMPRVERRVAAELLQCLLSYAALNDGRYPWPVPISNLSFSPDVHGVPGTIFGRVPDEDFIATEISSAGSMKKIWHNCDALGSSYIDTGGAGSGWWSRNKWYETIFYGFAPSYQPSPSISPPCTACISINTPTSSINGKPLVVIASGRTNEVQLANPDPLKKTRPDYYLELNNATPFDNNFFQGPRTANFNDQVLFSP